MRVALVVPHIFMHQEILPDVIFSPSELVLNLARSLVDSGHQVTVFSPGPIDKVIHKKVNNFTVDLSQFEAELEQRGDTYLELLKKHPLTYITLARQVQSELIAQAYEQANQDDFDLVHVWCNEEELALVNARFCQKPVVFTHHEPFNFLTRYRSIFPKYAHLNWISMSLSQRLTFESMLDTKVNWVGNAYHGLPVEQYHFSESSQDYLLYMGRIIQPKGVHYAIAAAKEAGLRLKIAGKHYAGHSKDKYWQEFVEPELEDKNIEYVGFVKDNNAKQKLIGQAKALLMPSVWSEPFGLVMIEALACGTPVIGFNLGSIPEVIKDQQTGFVIEYKQEAKVSRNSRLVKKNWEELQQDETFKLNVNSLTKAINSLDTINRLDCRKHFEDRFSLKQMTAGYEQIYKQLLNDH